MSAANIILVLLLSCAVDAAISLPKKQRVHRTVYGYVHIAKVAGTNLNGALSMRFERVCGNKGYSYDAFQHNERVRRINDTDSCTANLNDVYSNFSHTRYAAFDPSKIKPDHFSFYNRGRVIWAMDEIGFERCDFIADEAPASRWGAVATALGARGASLQLHVPCREPVDHLMSMLNHAGKPFDCRQDIGIVKPITMDRFMNKTFQNMDVKCYNDNVTFTRYLRLMESKLQPKKIPAEYVDRKTNHDRDRSKECIWLPQYTALRRALHDRLVERHDYFKFCSRCLGSPDDLFAA